MKWRIRERVPHEKRKIRPPGGADATVWEWPLVSEDGSHERTVQVWVTGTAMSSSGVHFRVDDARKTGGEDEIGRVLEWEEPPERIDFGSDSAAPSFEGGQPGPDVRELTAIVEWFDERGIAVIFTGHGVGVGPNEEVEITQWTANIYDLKTDKLIARFGGVSRLDAARTARREFEKGVEPPSASAEASAPAPTVVIRDEEQRDRLRQRHISVIENAPIEGDPDSAWVLEAYDKSGNIVGIAVQETQTDAWLNLVEEFLPEED